MNARKRGHHNRWQFITKGWGRIDRSQPILSKLIIMGITNKKVSEMQDEKTGWWFIDEEPIKETSSKNRFDTYSDKKRPESSGDISNKVSNANHDFFKEWQSLIE